MNDGVLGDSRQIVIGAFLSPTPSLRLLIHIVSASHSDASLWLTEPHDDYHEWSSPNPRRGNVYPEKGRNELSVKTESVFFS